MEKIQFRAFANCGLTSIKLQDLYGDVQIERTALGYKIGTNGSETKINGFKIYGNPGTSVEKYARENGFEFISSKPKAERFTLKLASETMDYTGKAVKPKITVTYKGKKVAAKNYTVKYSNNKETGTATIEWQNIQDEQNQNSSCEVAKTTAGLPEIWKIRQFLYKKVVR